MIEFNNARISINDEGTVILNNDAVAMYGEDPDAYMVGILWHEEELSEKPICLVIQAAEEGDEGTFTPTKTDQGVEIDVKTFLELSGLSRCFDKELGLPHLDTNFNALVVALDS